MNNNNVISKIRNVTIPDFFNLSLAEEMTVILKDGFIDRVEKAAVSPGSSDPLGSGEIDGKGMVLIPGMVNLHAHTAMTLLRGTAEDCNAVDWFNKYIWIYEQGLTPDDVYVGTLLGGAEMLLNGVTAVADHYFAMDKAWKAYDELGMRADLAWAVFGMGDDAGSKLDEALAFSREYRGRSAFINVSLGPHSPYLCPDDFLEKMVRVAADENFKLHLHVAEDYRQMEISARDRGRTPVEVLRDTGVLRSGGPGTILAHAYYATDSDMKIMAESSSFAAHCPKTYLRFGDSHDFLPRALDAGVSIALGSDGAASNSTMNIAEAARLAALMAKGTSGRAEAASVGQMLPLMFSGGQALGLPNYGAVVAGAPADLVLLDMNTPEMIPGNNIFADILYGLDGRNVHTVIVGGKPVVREGKLLTVDFKSLRDEARGIARRLLSTVADKPMQTY
ncbi:MAG: amidohydrolase [Spirochaetales bacterium]|nr:amidohydrolase [Spirochaetales bacterium]